MVVRFFCVWILISQLPVFSGAQAGLGRPVKGKLHAKRVCKLGLELHEISGQTWWQNKVWALNDGGNPPVLYGIDMQSGKIKSTIHLPGAINQDWEALAQDSLFFYIADVGNNTIARNLFTIYRVPKKALEDIGNGEQSLNQYDSIQFFYPLAKSTDSKMATDCESVVFANGKLHLFQKNWLGNYSRHYTILPEPGLQAAYLQDSLYTNGFLLTDGCYLGNNEFVFTSYTRKGKCALFVYNVNEPLRMYRLRTAIRVGQIESICEGPGQQLLIGNERFKLAFKTVRQQLRQLMTRQLDIATPNLFQSSVQ